MTITAALATSMPTSITLVATSTSASPEAKRAIAACLSRACIWPWRTSTVKSRNSVAARRLASSVAARAWSFSDSETSGQTT